MATITLQRDLVVTLKKETYLNVEILSKLQPMHLELSKQFLKEEALEKPTQNFFNHLSYYLVKIINPQKSASLPWPLYDTKTERVYRNEFSNFIAEYSAKNLLSPVMSSYLVNPACYKVTILIFQLSQLAVQQMLKSKMVKDHQKKLYNDMTEVCKSQNNENFIEIIDKETNSILSNFSNYLEKRKVMQKIAGMMCIKISEMEKKLSSLNAQKYIVDLVDGFLNQHSIEESVKTEIIKVKDIYKPSQIFNIWLDNLDEKNNELDIVWNDKMSLFLHVCKQTVENAETLIARHTGELDKNSYMIEFNPKHDEICTIDLHNDVSSEQKYILKNIIRNERLNFPYLVRGFVISICYILNNAKVCDEIYMFNECLNHGRSNFSDILSAMKVLMERVITLDSSLQTSSLLHEQSVSMKEISTIPPLPDLSDLKANREFQSQVLFDTFTPWSQSKHQFNLRKKRDIQFTKPRPKSLLITPFHQPRDDILKGLISSRFNISYREDVNNVHNLSMSCQMPYRANETISKCSSGFTKQQMYRLLSTKKSSSSKKFKFKTKRPDINIKKGGLFNESTMSNESSGLFRSYSSPNLFEYNEKKYRGRKLSVMPENSLSPLELSGIAVLKRDSYESSRDVVNLCNTSKVDSTSMPIITITPERELRINCVMDDMKVDLNKEIVNDSIESQVLLKEQSKDINISEVQEATSETPKNTQLIKKTSSIEKIINRFKKIRANVFLTENKDEKLNEIHTIKEEKEIANAKNTNMFTVNRILLPDLLSPSFNVVNVAPVEYLDNRVADMDHKQERGPRESLGMALGVDHTFLDQFDLKD